MPLITVHDHECHLVCPMLLTVVGACRADAGGRLPAAAGRHQEGLTAAILPALAAASLLACPVASAAVQASLQAPASGGQAQAASPLINRLQGWWQTPAPSTSAAAPAPPTTALTAAPEAPSAPSAAQLASSARVLPLPSSFPSLPAMQLPQYQEVSQGCTCAAASHACSNMSAVAEHISNMSTSATRTRAALAHTSRRHGPC